MSIRVSHSAERAPAVMTDTAVEPEGTGDRSLHSRAIVESLFTPVEKRT